MSEDKESNVEEPLTTEQQQNIIDRATDDIGKSTEMMKKLSDEIKKLEAENSDLKDKWQRALADYQNLERRTQVEVSQRVSSKTNDLLLNFHQLLLFFLL